MKLTAAVTIGTTPYHACGTFSYDESTGIDVGTFADPRGQFTVTCKRVKRSDCPLELDFRRITSADGLLHHAYIVFYWGDPSVCDASVGYGGNPHSNVRFGAYSVNVAGDFTGTASTTEHYRYARWRWCSWGKPEQWPFPLTPTATLVAEKLVQAYDATLPGSVECIHCPGVNGSPYAPYQPMKWAGLRSDWGGTGEDTVIGLLPDQAAMYFATGSSTALTIYANMTEAFNSYPLYFRDPATGAILNCVGPSAHRQYYGWRNNGPASHRPTLAQWSALWNCRFDGPNTTILPSGLQIVDQNNRVWTLSASHTLDGTGCWTGAHITALATARATHPPISRRITQRAGPFSSMVSQRRCRASPSPSSPPTAMKAPTIFVQRRTMPAMCHMPTRC
jgi:hypothetical protein